MNAIDAADSVDNLWKMKIAKIEVFLQKEWIPLFVNKFVMNPEMSKIFGICEGDREKFETVLHECLTGFSNQVEKKRYELLKIDETW